MLTRSRALARPLRCNLFVSPKLVMVQGPRMVRDVFRLAKENAPAIIFIDEIDAIATARFDAQTGADREVQRILMELLNQVRAVATCTRMYTHGRLKGYCHTGCHNTAVTKS